MTHPTIQRLAKINNDLTGLRLALPEDATALGMLDLIQAFISDLGTHLGSSILPVIDYSLTYEEAQYVITHNPIIAIKEVRVRTGCALKEAKDIVDTWRANHAAHQFSTYGNWMWDGNHHTIPPQGYKPEGW